MDKDEKKRNEKKEAVGVEDLSYGVVIYDPIMNREERVSKVVNVVVI